jgi:hypothetical protein
VGGRLRAAVGRRPGRAAGTGRPGAVDLLATQPYTQVQSFLDDDRIRATYGANWDRLVEVKRRWDPDNLLRSNRDVRS